LAVSRGPRFKYVQFATDGDVFAPLLFDLTQDAGQTDNLLTHPESEGVEVAWRSAQELLRWHMRSAERTLSGSLLDRERGLVVSRDEWR
jgi:hypothetical protein